MNPNEPSEKNNLSDIEMINFVINNLNDDELLIDYFSNLNCPLNPALLTLKLSSEQDASLGEKECNFLGYAALFSKPYLNHLIQLASPDALNAALKEDAINPHSETALHSILNNTNKEVLAILELIQKANIKIISEASLKLCLGRSPFFMALDRKETAIGCALICKMDKESLDHASRIFHLGLPIIENIVNRNYPLIVVETLLEHLNTETTDFLMLTTLGHAGQTPLHRLIQDRRHIQENEPLICLLISHTSPATLFAIAKIKLFQVKLNLVTLLISKQVSPRIIDTLFSRLEKNDVKTLFLSSEFFLGISPLYTASQRNRTFLDLAPTDLTKEINPTMMAIIKYLDKETL